MLETMNYAFVDAQLLEQWQLSRRRACRWPTR
jgi:hypothetical protein